MTRWNKDRLALLGGGVAALFAVGAGAYVMPPITPSAPPAVHAPLHTAAPKPAPSTSAPPPTTPNYGALLSTIARLAKALGFIAYIPAQGTPGMALENVYTYHKILTLEFNSALLMESRSAMVPRYRPTKQVSVPLSSGVTGHWLSVPYGGGPAHRLLFREHGVYFRLQILSAPAPQSSSIAEEIAGSLHAVPSSTALPGASA